MNEQKCVYLYLTRVVNSPKWSFFTQPLWSMYDPFLVCLGKCIYTYDKFCFAFCLQITQLKIDHNPFAKGFRDNFDK